MNPVARNATLVAIELRKLDGKLSALAAAAFDEAAKEIEKLEAELTAAKVAAATHAFVNSVNEEQGQ